MAYTQMEQESDPFLLPYLIALQSFIVNSMPLRWMGPMAIRNSLRRCTTKLFRSSHGPALTGSSSVRRTRRRMPGTGATRCLARSFVFGMSGTGQFVGVAVIRSRIHLAAKEPPPPHWYLAHNGRPEDPLGLADWYETSAHRWGLEPANRFRKERLYAELPKVQTAGRSDHWQLLLQVMEWMLYFARLAVTQKVLPWQKPPPPEKITPNRVIESLAGHLSEVGTPAQPPLPRGNAPGWPTGRPRTRPERYQLVPKTPKKTTKVSKNE